MSAAMFTLFVAVFLWVLVIVDTAVSGTEMTKVEKRIFGFDTEDAENSPTEPGTGRGR